MLESGVRSLKDVNMVKMLRILSTMRLVDPVLNYSQTRSVDRSNIFLFVYSFSDIASPKSR